MNTRSLAFAAFVFGCSSSSSGSSGEPAGGPDAGTNEAKLAFHENVEAILQDKCQTCHRPGGIAPFSLVTYEDVKPRAAMVVDQMKTRSMPPWGAFAAPECTPRHTIYNDLGVAQADIDVVAKWYEQGSIKGDPAKAPAPKTFTDKKLREPTHSVTIAPHVVQPADRDEHICIPLDPKIEEDIFIDGFALSPGNAKVVHHAIAYSDPNGEGAAKAGAKGYYPCFGGPGVSNPSLLGSWVPGLEPTNYPANVGMPLTKNTKIVLQMHYHPSSMPETDTSKVELRAMKSTPTWQARIFLIGAPGAGRVQPGPSDPASGPAFLIPANAKAHTEEVLFTIPIAAPDTRIAALSPHMHWAGKKFKVEMERATPTATDPAKECLLNAPNYNFNWQRGYAYNAAVEDLPRIGVGDKLRIQCTYDNSMDNPLVAAALAEAKKTAPADVTIGEDTLDEMCLAGFVFYSKAP